MPKAKVTPHVDERTLREAKRVAAAQSTSLSAMVSKLLLAVTAKPEHVAIGPLTRSAMGIAKVADESVQELLVDALSVKFANNEPFHEISPRRRRAGGR